MNRTDRHHDRALLLFQQRRYPDAERELRAALAQDPDDPRLHALLALCLSQQNRLTDASAEADQAVGLGPDMPFTHYVRGTILHDRHRLDEAEPAARQAIALDPNNPEFRWLLGAILFDRRNWAGALETADAGLAADAEHAGCVNLRAMALVKLGRKVEAGAAIDDALARDPDNPATHANRGWTLLHQGEHRRALDHFREALRLDPNMEWARAGIVEALKARHLVYRVMLRYFLWTASLSAQAQWFILIGGYVGYQILRQVSASNPAIAPFTMPLIIGYVVFAVMTWLADPLFNLMLRLSRFGRLALSKRQTWASNVLGLLLLAAVTSAIFGVAGGGYPCYLLAALFGLLTVPASGCFRLAPGWPTMVMVAGTCVLAAVGFTVAGLSFVIDRSGPDDLGVLPLARTARDLSNAFLWGFLISQFGYSYLRGIQPPR